MLGRPIVALILALLPLTSSEQLSSNDLLSIGAGLFAILVVWETVTALEKGACAFEKWHDGNLPQVDSDEPPSCPDPLVGGPSRQSELESALDQDDRDRK